MDEEFAKRLLDILDGSLLTMSVALASAAIAIILGLLTASAILFYDAAIKYIPSFGLVSLGLIYAAHMLIPNVDLVFVWPVWVAMSHSLLVGAMTHRLAGRRPALTPPVVVLALAGR